MTISESFALLQYVANKNQNGNITPAQFNLLAPIAQMSVINDRLGNVKKYKSHDPVPPFGYGISQKGREELRPITNAFQTLTLVSTSKYTYPVDSLYIDHISVAGRTARPVGIDEYQILSTDSVIKAPSAEYPVYCPMGDSIYIYPAPGSTPLCTYVRRPITPIWNYTIVNGEAVYAATGGIIGDGLSHDFELSVTTHFEICMRMLSQIGINLSMDSITQYAELQEQKGT